MPDTAAASGREHSYRDIVNSSSIIGGSSAIGYLLGLVSAKASALFLGPEGVGVLRFLQNTMATFQSFASLGIFTSGMREIAEAAGAGRYSTVSKISSVLNWAAWVTGGLGWGLAVALAIPISLWAFKSTEYAAAIAILGCTVTFGTLTAKFTAVMQGLRKISVIAKSNITAGLLATFVSVTLFWGYGTAAIVPAVALSSIISMIALALFSANNLPRQYNTSAALAFSESRRLLRMGVAFMWVGFSSTLVTFATGALIVRTLGEEANGYYSAAWTISGMFANFVLSAMGMDFLPRLTAANKNNTLVCKLVNEQTEIGILVSIAGLVATLFFAPLLIQIIYSKSFAVSATLLPWLILGVFGRVISWPMGYILMAKGYAGLFAVNDLLFNFLNMVIILVGLSLFGLEGAAVSFFIIYILYTAWMLCLTKRLVGFSWSSRVLALVGFSMTFLGIGFLLPKFIPGFTASLTGFILCVFLFAFSAREIIHRLGESHPLSNFTAKSPLISWIFTEKKNSNQIKRS